MEELKFILDYAVTVPIAKKLKEIGFVEKCLISANSSIELGYYEIYFRYKIDRDYTDIENIVPNSNDRFIGSEESYVSLPLCAQVLEWFRNKGYVFKISEVWEGDKKDFYHSDIVFNGVLKYVKVIRGIYRDAELDLINKLIEIYKENEYEIIKNNR